MGDFATGKVQSDVELITGAPALVVAKLETKAPEHFAQLTATAGATDEEKLQQLPLSLAAFLRLHDGGWQINEFKLLSLAQISPGSQGVVIALHLFDEGDALCIGADGGLVMGYADGETELLGMNTDEYLIKFFREVTSGKLEYTDPGWAEVGGA
jgi:hypothetical protein